jgi:uncharacterized membrane protein
MNYKRITGVIAAVIGIVLILISMYIKGKVAAATEGANEAAGLFSMSKYTESAGSKITEMTAAETKAYIVIANVMQYGGIALVVLGGIVVIFGKKKR